MKKVKLNDIEKLSYTDFVSLIKEENRPSGGKKTIRDIVQNSFISDKSKVLEVGCTNGFSSLEINRLVNANVIGIDINENSVKNANDRIDEYKLDKKKIKFEYGNAEKLKYNDNTFDLIVSGNAISFMNDRDKAITEMIRVLKPNGFISIVPIWYKQTPDEKIISKVNKELGFNIKCTMEKDWLDYSNYDLELYYKKDYTFIKSSKEEIRKYVDKMIDSKEELKIYNKEEIQAIKKRWERTISTFNDNLAMANYSVILLRKNLIPEEEEIFKTKEI